jgi:hypothetical protein
MVVELRKRLKRIKQVAKETNALWLENIVGDLHLPKLPLELPFGSCTAQETDWRAGFDKANARCTRLIKAFHRGMRIAEYRFKVLFESAVPKLQAPKFAQPKPSEPHKPDDTVIYNRPRPVLYMNFSGCWELGTVKSNDGANVSIRVSSEGWIDRKIEEVRIL